MARAKTKARRRRSPVPRILAVCALFLACFLYYRPVQAYVHTRAEVHRRSVEVAALHARQAALERQLRHGQNEAVLQRQARRLGYVKPGEKLFIVKGIDRWRAAHAQKHR
jgi:cell division protein FtsB